jgi:outer membrane beta-barrel protein
MAIGCCLMLLLSTHAVAQDADSSVNDAQNEVSSDGYSAEQSAAEKAIAAIEPRPFSKAGRGEIALGLGTIASDIFIVYLPVTLRGAYHFKEWVSLELAASYMGCFSDEVGENMARSASQKCMRVLTPTYDRLADTSGETQLRGVTIKEYQVARFGLNPVFSPFMGKFSLMNRAIVHYDLNLTAGLGLLIVEMPDSVRIGKINYGTSFEGNFGLGLRFVFLNFVGLRLDFREYLFGKQNDKGLGTSSEIALSVSFLL